jgi:predicted glutamine amidotransferase
MCELFAMSSGHHNTAQDFLPPFADKARSNIHGWGIGFFRNGQVLIEKSCEGIFAGDQMHDSFRRLARVIDSRTILCHIRCEKSGHQSESQAQPLTDHFLDHHWLFTFAGEAPRLLSYRSTRPLMPEPVLGARVFEFLRDEMVAGLANQPSHSLYQVLGQGCKKLITTFPGKYLWFLANETVLFAFLNHGQVLTYRDPRNLGEVLVLTTIPGGLTRDPSSWGTFSQTDPRRGQLLIVSGADLLYLGHL